MLFDKLFKYKKNTVADIENKKRNQFEKAIHTAELYLSCNEYSIEEKKTILTYMMDVIKRDIQSEYIADLFYNDESKRISLEFVPTLYFDKDGIKHYLEFSECQEVSLKDNYVITFPLNCGRMGDNILNIIKNGFKNYPINHIVYYYKELNICQVMNGNHSIAAGIYTEKGTVLAKIVDMKPLFENLKTDGAYYYSIHNNTIIEKVQDFRIAVIFEIAKMKYKLENELEP